MKIKKVNVEKLELKLLKPLRVAFTTFEGATTVLIKIETDEGIIGYGEAHPPVIITGETSDSVIEAIRSIGKHLEGIDPLEIPRIHHMMNVLMFGNTAAKAGIDMALYDIAAKHAGLPLYRYLGGGNNRVDTDVTIGINSSDVMISEAKAIIRKGYRMIKVKIGKSAKDDVVLIKSLRRSIDSNVKIRLDANQGYTVTEAILVMKALEAEDIELVEQPIKHWDYQGLQTIRNKAIIPLFADESLHSPQDAFKLANLNAVDGFNIKLMKCGGLYRALQIIHIAESANKDLMIGCMLESKVSITAAASLAASQTIMIKADLDSHLHLKEQHEISGGITMENGTIVCPDKLGLGIDINM